MKVVVIGGGVGGMFCAGLIAQSGADVVLVEKNEKLGKKLFITGKGRCNLTNDCDRETLLANVVTGARFLTSAISRWTPQDTMRFVSERGVPLKVERGNRVFPQSDHSSDIIKCFERFIKENGVRIRLDTTVEGLDARDGVVRAVRTDRDRLECDAAVIATGGISYPQTGSTGDGYRFAKTLGHTVVQPKPALAPLIADTPPQLAGLTLKNVCVSVCDAQSGRKIAERFGEMLFTHEGVSGPIALSLSSEVNRYWDQGNLTRQLELFIDLKPALDEETLDARLLREFSERRNSAIKNAMGELLPKSLIDSVLACANVAGAKQCNAVTKTERVALIRALKNLKFGIRGLAPVQYGIVTSGGIDLKEVNPKTMESKFVRGLYFIGEVLDVDALTGGFNIQLALSTAHAAADALKQL